MVKDLQSVGVKLNQFLDAENMKLSDPSSDTLGAATVTKGNTLAIDLGTIDFATDDDDYTGIRVAFDVSGTGILHNFVINNNSPFSISSALGTPILRYNDLVAKFIVQVNLIYAASTTKYIDDPNPTTLGVKYVGFKIAGHAIISSTTTEDIASVDYPIYTLKEFYGTAKNGDFMLLKTLNIGHNLYVLSSNGFVTRLGVGVENPVTLTWTYTIVFETGLFTYATDAIVDLPGEVDFKFRVSLYPTSAGYSPRVIYVTLEDVWTAGYAFIWNEDPDFIVTGNPDGYFTHENVFSNTKLQVLENYAMVSSNPAFLPTIQGGGALKAGDKMYIIRQLISDTSATGWGIVSNPISVFADSLTDPNLSGSAGGALTNKSITLQIEGLNPDLYSKFQVAVIEDTDGVISAAIIGTYPTTVTAINEFQAVTHTGNEVIVQLSLADIVTQQIIIKDAGNAVIDRDRLFLSDITIQLDYDLAAATKSNSSIVTQRTTIPACGVISSVDGEYQDPINVYAQLGYMPNETYRFGAKYIINGFITSPYFISDYTISYPTNEITDNSGGVPDNVYVYRPRISININAFPAIDGVPFENVVNAIIPVRCECIKEVLATGIVGITESNTSSPNLYFTGNSIVNSIIADPGTTNRKRVSFMPTDGLFGKADITFINGDQLINYGQPYLYNTSGATRVDGSTIDFCTLKELSGDFTAAPETIDILDGETVAFNSTGNKILDGYKYSTLVNTETTSGKNSQRSMGLLLNDPVNPLTPNEDHAFYYNQYFRPQTNKYGDETQGKYFSCGVIVPAHGLPSVAFNLKGGDTFPQKTIIKFCNKVDKSLVLVGTLQASPPATTPYSVGVWNYYLTGTLPSGVHIYNRIIIIRNVGNQNESVLFTWNDLPGTDWSLVALDPVTTGRYEIYSGTDSTFTDTNAIIGATVPLPPTTPGDFTERVGITLYSQNRINTQMRYFTDTETNLNFPYQTTDLVIWLSGITTGSAELDEGTLLYSDGYTPSNNFQTFQAFDPTLPTQSDQPNVTYYSELKVAGSPQDPYRYFLPLNFKQYPSIYGRITNTFRNGNSLIILMENGVLEQQLDQQAVEQGSDSISLILGNGTLLGARESILSNFGSPIKTAALQYLAEGANWFTTWFSPYRKKWLRFGRNGVTDLGGDHLLQSFLNDNMQFVGAEKSVVFGYDPYSSELMMSTNGVVPGSTLWSDVSTYTEGQIVYLFPQSILRCYFKAKRAVPANKTPDDPANQLQYWEVYRNSNFTLIFNEKINAFGGFYSFKTTQFVPYENNYLTINESNGLYEHNRGDYLVWYDTLNAYPYIETVLNHEPDEYKVTKVLWSRSDNQPLYAHVVGINGSKTYIDQNIFRRMGNRKYWWATVMNDATLNKPYLRTTNTQGLNTLHTGDVTGETVQVKIYFEGVNKINEISMKYHMGPRSPKT